MTATELVEAVANEIRDAVANLKLPLEHHDGDGSNYDEAQKFLVPVNVFEGFLPREAFNNDSYWPLVTVEWMSTNDTFGPVAKSISTIGLTIGVFAAENWGWKDALHLAEVIRHRFLTRRVVGKKFRLTGDADWEVSSEQPLPFYIIYGVLQFETFQPSEAIDWSRH